MTMLNAGVLADCSFLMSDSAVIYPNGKVAQFAPKVVPIPHLNLAVGVRGVQATASIISGALSAAQSYDDLRARIVDIVHGAFQPIRSIWEKQFGPHVLQCEIFVAGWSTHGPHSYVLATSDVNGANGLPAWTPLDIPGVAFTPSDESLSTEFANLQTEFSDSKLIELAKRQREIAAPTAPLNVGGAVVLTTVREHNIETRVIHRFAEDRTGELLGSPTIAEPQPCNRTV